MILTLERRTMQFISIFFLPFIPIESREDVKKELSELLKEEVLLPVLVPPSDSPEDQVETPKGREYVCTEGSFGDRYGV